MTMLRVRDVYVRFGGVVALAFANAAGSQCGGNSPEATARL